MMWSFHNRQITATLENSLRTSQQLMEEQDDELQVYPSGYCKVKVSNPDGSYSIKRIYAAAYRQYEQSSRAWALYKALYLLLFVLAVVLAVPAMLSASPVNNTFSNIAEAASFFALLFVTCTMLYQVFAPRHMTIRQHERGSTRLKTAAKVYGSFLILIFALMLLAAYTGGASLSAADVFCMVRQPLAAALMFLIFGLEKKRSCIEVQNKLPDNVKVIA